MSGLLVGAIAVTGCSGGKGPDSEASTTSSAPSRPAQANRPASSPDRTAPLSKSQLIAKADSICRRMNTEFAAHEPRNQSIGESARIVPRRVAVEQRVVLELSRLTPPSAIARDLQRVVDFRKTLADELAELAHVAKSRDMKRFHELAASKARVHSELLAAARGAGFTECGQTG